MLEILYEDKNLVFCVKPVGLSSQRDERRGEDMLTRLDAHFKSRGDKVSKAYPVHRLDNGVGGVMVYAKNGRYAAKLSELIARTSGDEEKQDGNECFIKEYFAVIHGEPEEKSGTLCDLLYHDKRSNKTFVVDRARAGVKRALLKYEVVASAEYGGERLSLVKIMLITGRSHQIRVQFASRKMPLAGDNRYGARDGFKEIGLWAHKLTLRMNGAKEMCFFKEMPNSEPWTLFEEKIRKKVIDKI